jgi:hypothetical protein
MVELVVAVDGLPPARRCNQGLNFSNLCSHNSAYRFGLARIDPVLKLPHDLVAMVAVVHG